MIYEINNTVVPQGAYDQATTIRRNGGKCHLMIANGTHAVFNPSVCTNCGGVGEVMIEVITGGPSNTPLHVNPDSGQTTTNIDDKWYKRRLDCYGCPVCMNTGKVKVTKETA